MRNLTSNLRAKLILSTIEPESRFARTNSLEALTHKFLVEIMVIRTYC